MTDILQYEFMRHALLGAILVSIACGIIGSLVVVNRLVFLAGGVAHSAFGGIGLAFYFGIAPLIGTTIFAVISALLMGFITIGHRGRSDTTIGVIWALGMAIGIIFLDLTPGYHPDLMSYLFGSILAIPTWDLWVAGGLDLVIIITLWLFYKEILALSYDEEFSIVMGVPVRALYILMLTLTALSVVILIRLVGLILVIALLSIPAFIAQRMVGSLGRMMVLASFLGAIFTLTGLFLSYAFNITSGATIIMVAGIGYFISLALPFKKGDR